MDDCAGKTCARSCNAHVSNVHARARETQENIFRQNFLAFRVGKYFPFYSLEIQCHSWSTNHGSVAILRRHSCLPTRKWGFFLGGGSEVFFAIWPISSYVGVQIVRELVRLMTPIGLNKYLTNVTSPTSLKKFFTHDILMIRRQKTLIFDVLKAFTSNFTYYNLY